jgi:hypothetical protein
MRRKLQAVRSAKPKSVVQKRRGLAGKGNRSRKRILPAKIPHFVATKVPPQETGFSINILGKKYTIKVDESMREGFCGHTIHSEQAMTVSPGQNAEFLADTIIHEALHAISEQLNLKLTEEQIHPLSAAIYAFIKENVNRAWANNMRDILYFNTF